MPPVTEEDTVTTKAFAVNFILGDVEQNMPQIFRDLSLMEKLPLTGKCIYDILKDPANGITTHLVPVPDGEPLNSHYYPDINNAEIARGAGTLSTFLEYFHAAQDVNDGDVDEPVLTMKDAVVAALLVEASAVAYQLAARQEAENHNVKLFDTKTIVKVAPGGETVTYSTKYTSDNPETRIAFYDAYIAAWKKNAGADAQSREAKSLEAGGKAVVRHLLDGKDAQWKEAYMQQTILNMIKMDAAVFLDDGRESKPGYKDRRSDFYTKQGGVLPQINFIPEEYLGADADQYIDKCFNGMVSELFKPSPAPTKVAQKHKPFFPR